MFLNKEISFLLLLFSISVFAQQTEVVNDSIPENVLDEVVVTGQYNPQSIKKSIYNVKVINSEQIERQAANNLADLLNFNLNLTIVPSAQTGKSTISFFGLDAQYFNILVDNIPLVSDSSFGNNIDLTQINLDDIERIEIVEGAMGVEYGANAVSGVINIISKKSAKKKWNIRASIQEETVSDEYAYFDQGRHIQSVNIAHNIADHWFGRIGVNRNQFAGFYDSRQGRDYYENDGLRGYSWLPKNQINTNTFLSYRKHDFDISYKFEYFNELINYYDASVISNYDPTTQTINPTANDKEYTTNRFVNNINLNGSLASGARYTASFSYQTQKRHINEFTYYILGGQKVTSKDEIDQSSEVLFSKGLLSNLSKSKTLDYQLGYETRFISGFDATATGVVTQEAKEKNQDNYALFASSEINLSNTFMLRPGVRYEYNSLFNSKLLGSLSARYLLKNGFELRGNVGSSYRTPNFQELYYKLVNVNHDITGNENLNPENGFSASLNLKKRSWFKNTSLTNALKVNYLDLVDKIDLAVISFEPRKERFINVDAYKLWGVTSENSIKGDNYIFNLGATVQGISQINKDEVNAQNDFLYSYQINGSITYQIKKWNAAINMLLKHNGEEQDYVVAGMDEEGNSVYEKSTTAAYSLLDASIKKSFLNNQLQTTIGARNLLDVTNVNVSRTTGGGAIHGSNNSATLLGYGRSYYLKLLYNLNF